ncbi:Mitochondrial distribution and morphology protein 12 [Dimargaris cristalligena]|nr:Mitochondrial distribution and morphology protein 12 [Dimargaris cristalligena]
MSLEIFWDKLDSTVARTVQEKLNSQFASMEKPDIIGDLEIAELDFGSVAPHIEILDITDPYPEFYYSDDETVAESNHPADSKPGLDTPPPMPEPWFAIPPLSPQPLRPPSGSSSTAGSVSRDPPPFPSLAQIAQANSGHSSTSTTTSNSTSTGAHTINHSTSASMNGHPSIGTQMSESPILAQSSAFRTHSTSSIQRAAFTVGQLPPLVSPPPELIDRVDMASQPSRATTPKPRRGACPNDTQMLLSICYKGNMSVTVKTSLRLNYPSPAFIELPVVLKMTGFDFSASAVVAYLKDRINFCFLPPENGAASLLSGVYVRSEIGDHNKNILRNIEIIERFVIAQLRRVLDNDFIFPSYHSISLNSTPI